MIRPLRKKRISDGKAYTRDPKIESLIAELVTLSRNELLTKAAITTPSDPSYIPSECLVYLIRANHNDVAGFESIYKVLATRVLRSMPRAELSDGTESLTRGVARDQVFGRFTDLLAADRCAYTDKLDYFEVRFDHALKGLRIDAQEKAWRDQRRSQTLEVHEESGEYSAEIEAAARNYVPYDAPEFDDQAYRSGLDAAIDTLPPEQARIIYMLKEGFPIDSMEPDVMTIAKALGRSEKTIRTYRDKAMATLRAIMTDGEER